MDPIFFHAQERRLLKGVLSIFARCLIVSNFAADALQCWLNLHLESAILNMRWQCGLTAARVYLTMMASAQLVCSILVVAKQHRFMATCMLMVMAHLRFGANPALWKISRYMDILGQSSAVLMTMLEPRRQAFITFLLITYLTWNTVDCPVWHVFYKYILKLLLSFLMVGFRLKIAAFMLIVFVTIHCLDAHAYWRVSITQENMPLRELKRFHFWNKITVIGGLLLSAVHRKYRHFLF